MISLVDKGFTKLNEEFERGKGEKTRKYCFLIKLVQKRWFGETDEISITKFVRFVNSIYFGLKIKK